MHRLFSIEVYIATKNPVHCYLILTRNNVSVASFGIWLAAIMIGSSQFWTDRFPFEILIACVGVLEVGVLVVIIIRILVVLNVRKSQRHIADYLTRDRLTVTFLLLFVVYMIAAFPYAVAEQAHFLSHSKPEWKINFEHDFIVYYLPIFYINFMVNPLIYA